jgi:hypothetical protein
MEQLTIDEVSALRVKAQGNQFLTDVLTKFVDAGRPLSDKQLTAIRNTLNGVRNTSRVVASAANRIETPVAQAETIAKAALPAVLAALAVKGIPPAEAAHQAIAYAQALASALKGTGSFVSDAG